MSHKLLMILAAASMAMLTACSAPAPKAVDSESAQASADASTATDSERPSDEGSTAAVVQSGPTKVMSCQQELTFEQAPERVVVMGDDAPSYLYAMGLIDKIVAVGKKVDPNVYPEEVVKALENVPLLEGTKTEGGGAMLSTETLLSVNPDLVIGYDSGADRKALTTAGVPFYSPDAWCPDLELKPVSFENINDEVKKYGEIFHAPDKAEALIKDLASKIKEVESAAPADRGTGVGIYIDEGSEQFWAYGNASMVQPMFEAVGLKNVYAESKERLIEGMSMEKLLETNPETVVLLYQHGTPESVKETFTNITGANNLRAVKENKLYAMPFRFTDPPSPNSVAGVEKLNEILGK